MVESQEQPERKICRVIVLGRDGTEVLIKLTGAGFVFPCVKIPSWERLADKLTTALKRDWGCEAVCLLSVEGSKQDGDSGGDPYEVTECWHDGGRKNETIWKPIRSLTADSFQSEAEFFAFEQCMHQLERYEGDPSSPFARRGWLTTLRDWSANVIQPLGLELTGPLRQYNAGPAFNLIRLETTGPAVWFKAVGEPNLREFPITMKLAELFPMFMPDVLAAKPEWNGWLVARSGRKQSRRNKGYYVLGADCSRPCETSNSVHSRIRIHTALGRT